MTPIDYNATALAAEQLALAAQTILPALSHVAQLQADEVQLQDSIKQLRADERKAKHDFELAQASADVFMGEYRRRRAELESSLRRGERDAGLPSPPFAPDAPAAPLAQTQEI